MRGVKAERDDAARGSGKDSLVQTGTGGEREARMQVTLSVYTVVSAYKHARFSSDNLLKLEVLLYAHINFH